MKRVALLSAIGLGGCVSGTPSADLLIVDRTGTVAGAKLTLRLQDGGEASCNGKLAPTPITSEQLIEARALLRAIRGKPEEDPPEPGLLQQRPTLPAREGSIFAFAVRTQDGTVRFADNSARLPGEYARVAKLTRDVARATCKLER